MVYAILAVVRDCRLTRGLHPCVQCHFVMMRTHNGGERGPVTFPAFKAGDSALRGSNGGFDFHTPPPYLASVYAGFAMLVSSSALYLPRKQPSKWPESRFLRPLDALESTWNSASE